MGRTSFVPVTRLVALLLALMLALSSVVAVSASHQTDQDEDQQRQEEQDQRTRQTQDEEDTKIFQDRQQILEERQQQLEEERQQLEEEIQQLEEEGAPARQIRQREEELQQIEQEQRQVERELQQPAQQQDQRRQQRDQELQQIEEEIQQVEEELQQAEEENAPQREIRQLEQELQQLEEERQQLEAQQEQQVGQRGQAEEVSLRDVLRNTDELEGQRVRVTGDLEETPISHVFALGTGNQRVAVIADPENVPQAAAGEEVVVVGTVEQATVSDLVEALDIQVPRSVRSFLRDLGPAVMIFADQVMLADEADQQGQVGQAGNVPLGDVVSDIFDNPQQFANQTATITGQVGQELDREAFTVQQGGDEILVVGDRQAIPANLGDQVEVQGEVREQFNVQDVEDELGVTLNQQLEEFEDQPFVVAEDVQTVDEQDEEQ